MGLWQKSGAGSSRWTRGRGGQKNWVGTRDSIPATRSKFLFQRFEPNFWAILTLFFAQNVKNVIFPFFFCRLTNFGQTFERSSDRGRGVVVGHSSGALSPGVLSSGVVFFLDLCRKFGRKKHSSWRILKYVKIGAIFGKKLSQKMQVMHMKNQQKLKNVGKSLVLVAL